MNGVGLKELKRANKISRDELIDSGDLVERSSTDEELAVELSNCLSSALVIFMPFDFISSQSTGKA